MAESRRKKAVGSKRLTVSGDLTVARAGELRTALSDALAQAGAVEVTVAKVTALDVTFPQLLCSAHRAAVEGGKELAVKGLDEESFGELLRRSGFLRHIGCREDTRRSCFWLAGESAGRTGTAPRKGGDRR